MDKETAIKTAKQYLTLVKSRYPFLKVLLFGSYAKGTARHDSDIDLAIVFERVKDIIDRQAELLKLRKDNELDIEPHPFRISDFDRNDPMVAEIMKNGIEILI